MTPPGSPILEPDCPMNEFQCRGMLMVRVTLMAMMMMMMMLMTLMMILMTFVPIIEPDCPKNEFQRVGSHGDDDNVA